MVEKGEVVMQTLKNASRNTVCGKDFMFTKHLNGKSQKKKTKQTNKIQLLLKMVLNPLFFFTKF